MRSGLRRYLKGGFAVAGAALAVGCGQNAIVGFGSGGNRIVENGMLEEVASSLARHSGTPQVTDAMLAEIFPAMLRRANEGDADAALVVLLVAEEQRRNDDD